MAKKLGESANKDAKLPNGTVVKAIVSRMDSMKDEMDEVRGELGAFIKDKEESAGIHRGALKLAARLAKMEVVKRAAFLAHLDHYREILDLDAQGELFPDEGADEEADEFDAAAPDPAGENAALLESGIKPLAH